MAESLQSDASKTSVHPSHGAAAARRRSKRWVLVAVGILVILAIVNGSMRFFDKPMPEDVDGAIHYDGLTSSVVDGAVAYEMHPPAGGPHAAVIQECGVYRVPINDANAVASLATGAVWIAYRPDLPSSTVKGLEDLALGERDLILAPYPDLRAPVVLTAWGVQLDIDDPFDDRVPLFLTVYANRDEAPDPHAPCVGGVGAP